LAANELSFPAIDTIRKKCRRIAWCNNQKNQAYKGLVLSGKRDSDSRPSAWEADALPTELLPLVATNIAIQKKEPDTGFKFAYPVKHKSKVFY
jgi:hypothetical protein